MKNTNEKMVNCCPIEKTLSLIGKKWSLNIIRDMFAGKKHFSEFLEHNNNISTKMLSTRLKELQKHCLIEKKITSTNPINVEYHLTDKGRALNKIIYEIAKFSITQYKKEILPKKTSGNEILAASKKMLKV